MTNHSIHQSYQDVIALETKLQNDFERSLEQQKFSKHYQDKPRTTFEDGKYDGELNLEPEPYQWFNPIYQRGYLTGIVIRFNELFSA